MNVLTILAAVILMGLGAYGAIGGVMAIVIDYSQSYPPRLVRNVGAGVIAASGVAFLLGSALLSTATTGAP